MSPVVRLWPLRCRAGSVCRRPDKDLVRTKGDVVEHEAIAPREEFDGEARRTCVPDRATGANKRAPLDALAFVWRVTRWVATHRLGETILRPETRLQARARIRSGPGEAHLCHPSSSAAYSG